MSKEILNRIRQRKNHPKFDHWQERMGEQKALEWVLRLFREHERSLKRRVLIEKYKKRKRKKRARRAVPPPLVFNNRMTAPLYRPGFLAGGWGWEIL